MSESHPSPVQLYWSILAAWLSVWYAQESPVLRRATPRSSPHTVEASRTCDFSSTFRFAVDDEVDLLISKSGPTRGVVKLLSLSAPKKLYFELGKSLDVEATLAEPRRFGLARPRQPALKHRLTPSLLELLPRAPPRSELRSRTGRDRSTSVSVKSRSQSERVELVAVSFGGGGGGGGAATRFEQGALALVVEACQVSQQRGNLEYRKRRREDRRRRLHNSIVAA